MPEDPRIVILCVGNLLMLDDGLGPQVYAELRRLYDFPPTVSLLERGVMGLAILADLRAAEELLVIDAMDNTGQPAGSVLLAQPEDLASYQQAFRSAHDTRLVDVLTAAEMLGWHPAVTCLGVQVANANPAQYQIGLSPAVQAALPQLVAWVEQWLQARGIQLTTRPPS
ncbi:MAG: hydrogenase maturation protease [Actinomycetia bacterium]|nr:hydrogenase maturation protease [Actinomycetes bacterium]